MALTKSLIELVQGRVARDPDFAAALLREGVLSQISSVHERSPRSPIGLFRQ